MYKDKLVELMQEIQSNFPPELLKLVFLKLVTPENLDEIMERMLYVYSPVFLPVLVSSGGDIIGIHLRPNSSWRDGIWVKLNHDATEPRFLASSFKYLPYAYLVSPLNIKDCIDDIWEYVLALFSQVGSETPDKEYVRGKTEEPFEVLSKYDRLNGVIKLSFFTGIMRQMKAAQEPVEKLIVELPDDTYVLAAAAIMRERLQVGDAVSPALKVLHREIPHGFDYLFWAKAGKSAPELLEGIRPIALPGLSPDDPLTMLKDASYTDGKTAEILRQIAHKFHEMGDEGQALNQLRNGASVAARYGGGLDKAWCLALAEQAERVEPGCAAAALAYYAAKVFTEG